jgi:hypothetical protein
MTKEETVREKHAKLVQDYERSGKKSDYIISKIIDDNPEIMLYMHYMIKQIEEKVNTVFRLIAIDLYEASNRINSMEDFIKSVCEDDNNSFALIKADLDGILNRIKSIEDFIKSACKMLMKI